jgi:hypothetical protein
VVNIENSDLWGEDRQTKSGKTGIFGITDQPEAKIIGLSHISNQNATSFISQRILT